MAAKPLPPPRSRYHAERIREVFTQLDKTGDGALSFLEIKKGLEENDVDWVRFPRSEQTPPSSSSSLNRQSLAALFFSPHFDGIPHLSHEREGRGGSDETSHQSVSAPETRFF